VCEHDGLCGQPDVVGVLSQVVGKGRRHGGCEGRRVTRVCKWFVNELLEVTCSDGRRLTTTTSHALFVPGGKGWSAFEPCQPTADTVCTLREGDRLMSVEEAYTTSAGNKSDGQLLITRLHVKHDLPLLPVYALSIEELAHPSVSMSAPSVSARFSSPISNYFANGMLVHNGSMQIFVKVIDGRSTTGGRILTLDVESSNSIESVKQQIQVDSLSWHSSLRVLNR